ncbi:hypothetical protein A5886_002000 [Enterococcus sp. 8G7_MSG3316]|uniref:Uncharacterized protein n=1 Tax=Candidatus Enterococcus testudinis TaxID=1834191 RepID=A0A242A868_9ENTE|nr:hypothetical protein [Enterococcus sp. 8G7_MSG3316]OTN76921.1 hypothetical protein A5886_002000 [Enterococcus sp. 8G7_MSG3316]
MEGLKEINNQVVEQNKAKAEMITFVSMAEIDHARQLIQNAGIDESRFSDGDLILALKEKEAIQANTVVPIVIDWLINKNYLLNPAQAVRFLASKLGDLSAVSYKVLGELDFDCDGQYYLIGSYRQHKATKEIYKVYTDGQVKELWQA